MISVLTFYIGLSSDVTPSSEVQAMVEAQREIMDMLGITDDTLSIGSGSVTGSFLRRRKSLSAVETSPTSANRTRRTSEILSPIQRATNMTDVSYDHLYSISSF